MSDDETPRFSGLEDAETHPAIEKLVAHATMMAHAQHAKVEKVCQDAIAGGRFGVLVLTDYRTLTVEARVDESVPYGRIIYRPKTYNDEQEQQQ